MDIAWISANPLIRRAMAIVQTGGIGDVTTSQGETRIDGEGTEYSPQVEEVKRCLRAGVLESPFAPQADTVAILELLEQARAKLGVRYPGEGTSRPVS